jgi:hypothetical protein
VGGNKAQLAGYLGKADRDLWRMLNHTQAAGRTLERLPQGSSLGGAGWETQRIK